MFGSYYQQRTNEMLQAGLQPVPVTGALDEWNTRSLQLHKERFPFTDNLMALVFAVLADLTENQRERMATHYRFEDTESKPTPSNSYEKLSLRRSVLQVKPGQPEPPRTNSHDKVFLCD
jgi:hypothetical protein